MTANQTEFTVSVYAIPAEPNPIRSRREHITRLLERYPQVSDADRNEILRFMKEARHLEVGLLTANDNVRPQLDAFMDDHKQQFRLDVFDVVRAVALIAAILTVCWLLWELFMKIPV